MPVPRQRWRPPIPRRCPPRQSPSRDTFFANSPRAGRSHTERCWLPSRLTKYLRLEDHEDGSDYGSSRSRFWFDIQRETQFRAGSRERTCCSS